jgi:hypothetical protein
MWDIGLQGADIGLRVGAWLAEWWRRLAQGGHGLAEWWRRLA